MAVVEEFCYAVKDKWPHALIQFEDFQTDRAFAILEKLQDKVLCFNDDIQVWISFIPGTVYTTHLDWWRLILQCNLFDTSNFPIT